LMVFEIMGLPPGFILVYWVMNAGSGSSPP
jgi:hypothetical protein